MKARMITPVLIALMADQGAFAQDDGASRLLQARSVRCEWGQGTQADWDTGKLSLTQGTFGKDATVTFDAIDLQKRTARMVANVGAGDVIAVATPDGLTFLEQTGLSVHLTTIFADGVGPTKQFVGVTSRHMSTFGGPFPSQWHGVCRILQ